MTEKKIIIAGEEMPPPLRNVMVRSLDLALLQAGAGIKREFENRLKGLIEEVKASPIPIILFIDEAHTMIGAGGQAGQNDAANLLKPALARGELRTIAATTWSEYKKFFEKDRGPGAAFPGGQGGRAHRNPMRGNVAGDTSASTNTIRSAFSDEGLVAAVMFYTTRLNPATGVIQTGFSDVNSWYNSMVLTLRKNASHGLRVLVELHVEQGNRRRANFRTVRDILRHRYRVRSVQPETRIWNFRYGSTTPLRRQRRLGSPVQQDLE